MEEGRESSAVRHSFNVPESIAETLLRMVQPRASALADILREIARLTDSYGCILWRARDSEELFILADSFPDGQPSHRMSGRTSITGLGIKALQQQVVDVSDLKNDGVFFEPRVETFCATPFVFRDGEPGSLNLYRLEPLPYDEHQLGTAREVAGLLPFLYDIIQKEVSFELTKRIDAAAQAVDFESSAPAAICTGISEAFDCIETSIYLETEESSRRYRLAATKAPWSVKSEYAADADEGLTGWSLAHPDVPVRIFDLSSTDPKELRKVYPGIRWLDSLRIRQTGTVLSFMAAPIVHGDRVLGVIRCAGRRSPTYFSDTEHSILQMMASRFAAVWSAMLDRRALEAESRSLATLVVKIDALNARAYDEVRKSQLREHDVLHDILRIAGTVIPGATIVDIRLLSHDNTLRYAAMVGDAWDQGSAEEIQRRKTRVYPVDNPPSSIGSDVVRSGQVRVMSNPAADPHYSATFPEATGLIVAPIRLQDHTFGVLDLRSTTTGDFPPFAGPVAELLGTQLALYLKLFEVVRQLRDLHESQVHINQDMAHQFKSPIEIAYSRVRDLLKRIKETGANDDIVNELLAVRGACARAMHVSQNSYVFAQLARNMPITIKKEVIDGDELISLLINTTSDVAELHFGPPRSSALWSGSRPAKRRFHVKTDGFHSIRKFEVDRTLLEQAVTQILDNAFKYSFPDTTVSIAGGYTHRGQKRNRLRISVISEGVPLSPEDARRSTQRGWQSDAARAVGQGGVGIGLWIVNEIMNALGGALEVHPTDAHSRTEVSLLLPVGETV